MPHKTLPRLAFVVAAALLATACAGPRTKPVSTPAPSTPRSAEQADAASTLHSSAASSDVVVAQPDRVAFESHAAAATRSDAAQQSKALARLIEHFLGNARFHHAVWGIHVVDTATGATRYAHHADKLFVPASNAKLYSAALALETLGPNTRFHTVLMTTARGRSGSIMQGDLVLRGGGDPSLGKASVAPGTAHWARRMAQAVAKMGITEIHGDLVADVTRFHGPPYGNGWEANDLAATYAPPVTALSSDGNLISITVRRHDGRCCTVQVKPEFLQDNIVNLTGSRTAGAQPPVVVMRQAGSDRIRVGGTLRPGYHFRRFTQAGPNPPRRALLKLRSALAHEGIQVRGGLRVVRWPAAPVAMQQAATVLVTVSSPPLYKLIHHMLKHSDNLFAQTLLLQVGVHRAGNGACLDRKHDPVTTEGWGLCAMRSMLRDIGIGTAAATFHEGAGLSRHDLVTPRATTQLLRWVAQQPFAPAFTDALPVAGVDGTLHWRLRHLPAGTSVQAKTGTLSHVHALSGYATDAQGESLAFSIFLNRYQRPRDANGRRHGPSANHDLDQVAKMIVESTPALRTADRAGDATAAGNAAAAQTDAAR